MEKKIPFMGHSPQVGIPTNGNDDTEKSGVLITADPNVHYEAIRQQCRYLHKCSPSLMVKRLTQYEQV